MVGEGGGVRLMQWFALAIAAVAGLLFGYGTCCSIIGLVREFIAFLRGAK